MDISAVVVVKGPGQDWCKELCKHTDVTMIPDFILPNSIL